MGGTTHTAIGELAQLARAPALHAGGQRFESVILHQSEIRKNIRVQFFDILKENTKRNTISKR
jgi:hypothetical protein